MVANVTSLTTNGLRDWLIQRVSAIILAAYTLFLTSFLITRPQVTYEIWHSLFQHPAMKIFTIISLVALIFHTWVGIWTVLTDYIKPTALRLLFQFIVRFSLIVFLLWGIMIVWGVN